MNKQSARGGVRPSFGELLRERREAKGFSRTNLAQLLNIDVTALAAWESGKYQPRNHRRTALAQALDLDPKNLFGGGSAAAEVTAIDTMDEMPRMLEDNLARTRKSLKAFRIAAPYCTAAHVQTEFRRTIAERLLGGSLEVQRVEVFYELERLKEVLGNIIRYSGRPYWVKSYCAGVDEVVPGFGGYIFDDTEVMLGAYWTATPPHNRPSLRLAGEPVRSFFTAYWDEIWRRGIILNHRGAHDLGQVRETAIKLGLAPCDWPEFVEQARNHDVGDGVAPMI
jgi:transcriptional regulator with XRE-family HTH domain